MYSFKVNDDLLCYCFLVRATVVVMVVARGRWRRATLRIDWAQLAECCAHATLAPCIATFTLRRPCLPLSALTTDVKCLLSDDSHGNKSAMAVESLVHFNLRLVWRHNNLHILCAVEGSPSHLIFTIETNRKVITLVLTVINYRFAKLINAKQATN